MQDVGRQVRWHLVHRLCQRDQTYSELQDALPSHLVAHHQAFDQVCCIPLVLPTLFMSNMHPYVCSRMHDFQGCDRICYMPGRVCAR